MKLSSSSSSNGVAGMWWVWIPLLLLWLLCTSTAWASPIVVENDGMIISSSLSSSTSTSSSSSSLTPHQRRELFDPVNSKPPFSHPPFPPFFPFFFTLLHLYISLSRSLCCSRTSFNNFLLFSPPSSKLIIIYIYFIYTNPQKKL